MNDFGGLCMHVTFTPNSFDIAIRYESSLNNLWAFWETTCPNTVCM